MEIVDIPSIMTGNGKHTTYRNGDDWGMISSILGWEALP